MSEEDKPVAPADVDVDVADASDAKADAPAPAEETKEETEGVADASDAAAAPAAESKPTSSAKAKSKSGTPAAGKAKPRSSVGKKAAPGADKSFAVGDIVLARLKGFPAWRDSWLNARDITPLSPSDIKTWLSETHRKASGGLREAYETAADPSEWLAVQDQARAEQDVADEDVDELEEEEGAGAKRKRAPPAEKSKKKPKTEKKKAEAAPKSKTQAPKSDAKDVKAADGGDELANDPEAAKVKDWRHKLQRAFLGKSVPEAQEMDQYDELFKTIENYKGMTIKYLLHSKIGKVMKKIGALPEIARDGELKISERANKLMNEWQEAINKENGENGEAKEADE
ncbi:hypothetical protein Q5752_006961 [Cryptotrichosporon argae]